MTTDTAAALVGGGAKIPKVKVRRRQGSRGFWHQGRAVQEGEVIETDLGTAQLLLQLGKVDYVG
jgi:hypothetical protein